MLSKFATDIGQPTASGKSSDERLDMIFEQFGVDRESTMGGNGPREQEALYLVQSTRRESSKLGPQTEGREIMHLARCRSKEQPVHLAKILSREECYQGVSGRGII